MNITDENPTSHAFDPAESSPERATSPTTPAPAPNAGDDPAIRYEADAEEADDADEDVVYICKRCMTAKSDDPQFCRDCGERLVPIRAVRDSYLGDTVGDKYKLVEQIGSGGMGEVYLGINEPLDQKVAVKFLSRDYTANEQIIMRFLNEARSYARVSHPNAVTLLDYGQHDDGSLYIITEYVEGVSLTDAINEHGPLPPKKALSVAIQICEVLSSAHSEGVIHRDLKPDNIMLMPASRGRYAVKVLDFGIAKIVDDEGTALTETGSVFGTPEFMSPEQAEGKPADARSDLYALGIILFYAATGRLPFDGESQYSVLEKQIKEAPPKASSVRDNLEVDPRIEVVIERCLQKERERRYETAADMLEALETALTEIAEGAVDSDLDIDVDVDDSDPEQRTVDLTEIMEDSDSDDTRGYPAGALEIDARAETEFESRIGDLEPEGGFEFSGELEAHDLSDERERPSTLTLSSSGAPLPAAGVAVAVLLVAALVAWQVWSSAEKRPTEQTVTAGAGASASAGESSEERARRLLSEAHGWLHEGTVSKARRHVDRAASMTASGDRSASFSSLLAATRRRLENVSTSRDTFTEAGREGDCDRAKMAGRKLVSRAPGTAPWVARKVNECTKRRESDSEPRGGGGAGGGSDESSGAAVAAEELESEPRESEPDPRESGARAAQHAEETEGAGGTGSSDSPEAGSGEGASKRADSDEPGESDGEDRSTKSQADATKPSPPDRAQTPPDRERAGAAASEKGADDSVAEAPAPGESEGTDSGSQGSSEPEGVGEESEAKKERASSEQDEVPDGMALPPSQL